MIARKLSAVPVPAPTQPSLADVQGELAAAQRTLSSAAAGVEQARADLDAAPRDAARRSVLREAVILAEEDLAVAQKTVEERHRRLNAAQRRDDERAANELAERIGSAAQHREAVADADEFVRVVGGAVEKFFERVAARNLQFRDEADKLNEVWFRLGHEHRIPGVSRELGTGTESIPPRVSLEALHGSYEPLAREMLNRQAHQATPVQQAVREFLRGALEHTRTLAALKKTLAHNSQLKAEAAASAPKKEATK